MSTHQDHAESLKTEHQIGDVNVEVHYWRGNLTYLLYHPSFKDTYASRDFKFAKDMYNDLFHSLDVMFKIRPREDNAEDCYACSSERKCPDHGSSIVQIPDGDLMS